MNTRLDTRTNMDTGERGCVKLSPDYTRCKTIVVWGLLHAVGAADWSSLHISVRPTDCGVRDFNILGYSEMKNLKPKSDVHNATDKAFFWRR